MQSKISYIFFFLFSILFSQAAFSLESTLESTQEPAQTATQQVKNILSLKEAPTGIVFEIVTGAENSLKWALPQTKKHIATLRKRFPNVDIAIVTHGNEQFALTTKNNKKYKKVHSLTQQLTQEDNIPLHVCGTFASWNNISEEEFPEYVDVTAAGPATINDYIALGYILIKL